MSFASLPDNLSRVREEIAELQQREGLAGPVTIVGVTKGHPPAAVQAAQAAGLFDIGENRVQEALDKQREVGAGPIRWHLIGHLQTNKARFVPGRFALVHSVDSPRVARALAEAGARIDIGSGAGGESAPRIPVLVQVNLSGEAQKSGCAPEGVEDLVDVVANLSGLRLDGLMTMAPFTDDEAVQRRVFGSLRVLRDRLQRNGVALPTLSMGMSGDYRSAVAEGATMVRLGSVLFGTRGE